MIVVSLMGGLGNQMFQYAFARGVSDALGRSAALDLTMLPTGKGEFLRRYGLGALPIRRDIRKLGLTSADASGRGIRWAKTLGSAARRTIGSMVFIEKELDCLIDLHLLPKRIAVCVGYWQSPLYFEQIQAEIRRELTPHISSGSRVEDILKKAGSNPLIAVHVRRGDYILSEGANKFHGVQGADYFCRAVQVILEARHSRATAVVLSDDPVWARENLNLGVPTLHPELERPLSTTEALAIMSRSQSHVISNSSFSWWGAWLADGPDQVVVYPAQWFRAHPIDPSFRFPAKWIPWSQPPEANEPRVSDSETAELKSAWPDERGD